MSLSESEVGRARKRRQNSREAILEAAAALVAEMGAAHLTLEAVARRAGISKGGLLYNFPSKLHLLQAMIERYVAGILTLAAAEKAGRQTGAALALRELLHSRLDVASKEPPSKHGHGVLAAMVEHPALLDPIREMHHKLWEQLKAARPDQDSVVLGWLAVEGLLSFELFRTTPFSAAERTHLAALAMRLIEHKLVLADAARARTPRPLRGQRRAREELSKP